jgi:MFS family permease
MVATTVLLREPTGEGQPAFVRPSRRLMLLGFIAFCAFLLDGVAYSWSAVHLRTQYDGSVGLAAAAFTVFAGALAIGRLFGDRLVARWGRVRVVQGCGAVAAIGSSLAVVAPTAGLSIAG